MSINVTCADTMDSKQWDRLVAASPAGTPFHRRASLEILANHTNTTLHPLVGFVGQEPVGVFPLFEMAKGPLTIVVSPPPNLKISYLGPALCNLQGLSTRKIEQRRRQFIDSCLTYVNDQIDPAYCHIRTNYEYTDPRPFEWRDFEVTARHTYVVALNQPDYALRDSFSSDARQNIQTVTEADCEIYQGAHAEIDAIIEQVAARHREQAKPYQFSPAVAHHLYDHLSAGTVRPYAAVIDGDYATGILTVETENTIYRWQGGVTPDVDLPINDALDWHIMTDAQTRDITAYDLVGANNPRLCDYKAKFAPDLRTYYRFERGSRGLTTAARIYSSLRQ